MGTYIGKTKIATGYRNKSEWKAFFDNGGVLCAPTNYNTKITTLVPYLSFTDTADVTDFTNMFMNNQALVSIPALDVSKGECFHSTFYDCRCLEEIPEPFSPKAMTTMTYMFTACFKLKKLPMMDTSRCTNLQNTFDRCNAITEMPAYDFSNVTNFAGAFSSNPAVTAFHAYGMSCSFDISSCTLMGEDALVEVLNNLADVTSKEAQTLTLGETLLAKLTDAEKKIATDKNWTLA